MKITILTPTYNRASCLGELYESLKKQTIKDFEWLVIDDGSTDETKQLIEKFQKENAFTIRYIRKQNGGKHTALNVGIKDIDSELVFIVDSDDMLVEEAVATVLTYHKKYGKRKDLCGYSFLRVFPDGKINGKKFPKKEWIASYIDARINNDDTHSDKAEIFFANILKKYPFPEYKGEKFLGEDIVWIRMAKKYNMVHINKGIYIGQYLNEGLTNNRRINNIKSPVGCMNRAKEFLIPEIKFKYRVKAAIQFLVYGKFAKQHFMKMIRQSDYKLLLLIVWIPSLILFNNWKKKYC